MLVLPMRLHAVDFLDHGKITYHWEPSRGGGWSSCPEQAWGTQQRPKSEPGGYMTPAVGGGGGGPQRFSVGDKINSGPQVGLVATKFHWLGGPQRFTAGDKISSGPQLGREAT